MEDNQLNRSGKSPSRGLNEQRLQRLNDLKPITKGILWFTLRAAAKMMKFIVKAAFQIPGLVKKAASASENRPTPNANPTVRK